MMELKSKISRFLFFLLAILFIRLCIPQVSPKVYCIALAKTSSSAEEEGEEKLNQMIIDQLSALDLDALQAYVESLGNFTNKSVVERLLAYIKAGNVDYESFASQISTIFFAKVMEMIPSFACIAAVTLLSGLISSIKSGVNGSTSSEMIFLITYAAALIPILIVLTECFRECLESISAMQTQMQILFPLMLTLMSASGGTLSAAVCRPAVAFFATNIVSVIRTVVFPICAIILVFSMANCLTKELKISRFTAFFKSMNKWIIGVCVSAFSIFFTMQGMTAANYDGIVRRTAKYAISNGIPIVGGFLSGGFDLAVAGSVLIKNALGNMGIFLMIAVIFEPLILLVSIHLLLRLTSAVTQSFGDGRISDFLGETADNLHHCVAAVLFTAFLYFLSIMLMVCASEALF